MSGPRFPGYDVLDERDDWDSVTRAVVESRLLPPGPAAFFTREEEPTCRALVDRLLANDGDRALPVFEELDRRLARDQTDGFRYEDMPPDGEAWRVSLRELEDLAERERGHRFHELDRRQQVSLLAQVKRSDCLGPLPIRRLWGLWMRYACAALYSHPDSWSEIGFGGPAYPRGYKNLGVDRREPWELPDARPGAAKGG